MGGKYREAMANGRTGKSRIEAAAPMKRDKAGLHVQSRERALGERKEQR